MTTQNKHLNLFIKANLISSLVKPGVKIETNHYPANGIIKEISVVYKDNTIYKYICTKETDSIVVKDQIVASATHPATGDMQDIYKMLEKASVLRSRKEMVLSDIRAIEYLYKFNEIIK